MSLPSVGRRQKIMGLQLRISWQAETSYDVKFCWSQWKLVELSIKGMSHSPVSMSCGKSLRLLTCRVKSVECSPPLVLFLCFKHAPFLSPMWLQFWFSFYSELLLLLNSEYLISSYSNTLQLPLQVWSFWWQLWWSFFWLVGFLFVFLFGFFVCLREVGCLFSLFFCIMLVFLTNHCLVM